MTIQVQPRRRMASAPNVALGVLSIVLALLRGGSDARAQSSDPIPSIRFSYEGESTLTRSPVFRSPKTDYFWGRFEKRHAGARHFRCKLYPSDPENRLTYNAVISEQFALDASTVLTYQEELVVDVTRTPRSLQEAKAMHTAFFTKREDKQKVVGQKFHTFRTVSSAHERLLREFHFLGMTLDGPIWALSKPTSRDIDDMPVYEYKSDDGIEYRFVCDHQRPLCWKCSVTFRGLPAQESSSEPASGSAKRQQSRDPYTDVTEITESKDGYILTSILTQNPSFPNEQVVRLTQRMFDVEFNNTNPITMVHTPEDGDRIYTFTDPQIKFEWQDGKVVKQYDPLLDEAGALSFVRSSRWIIAVNFVILLTLGAIIYWRWRKRATPLLVLVGLVLTASTTRASDSYCGVYSLYGAAKSLGVDVDLALLIDARYITSQRGSTADDLVAAAELIGLEATPLRGLGVESLKAAQEPLILHAAPMGTHAVYQHWILFLGFDENGQARVVDGAGGVATCAVEDVLARWDGIAIGIRKPNSPPTRYLSHEVAGLFLLIAFGGVFSLVVRSGILTASRAKSSRQSELCVHFAALLVASVSLGYVFKGRGFESAARGVDSALGLTEWPIVTVEEVARNTKRGAVLIDCRYKPDYDFGHIEGAMSVPIDAGLGEFTRLVAGIDRDAEVILYCQSSGCGFSGFMATMLAGAGFGNLSIFQGGYEAWEQYLERQ